MKIVISCHGNVAKELIKSVEMIIGENDNLIPIAFLPGEGREDLLNKYKDSLKSEKNDVLFLTDIFGGSPFNAAFEYVYGNDSDVITGVSLPLLIDVIDLSDKLNSPKEVYKNLNIEYYIKHIEEK
ncbi:PTS sugar transporter subunit IIA [Anaerococcus hydrogenalis]|uniref:PTS sugar transporter subunit IIA n=1 Tax=Anaerococcus hydrogenalis TaxID=33029 RepID=UPI0023F3495F|nr:PTS sugar transporter subunit IIA [Anaerococcus hydrogenalis]